MSNCPNCGSSDIDGAFCEHCGTRVKDLDVEVVASVSPASAPSTFQQASPPPVQDNYINVPSHLAQSIILTILCCMPAGIVAIVYSAGANSAKAQGQYELAAQKANTARGWIIAGWIVGVLWWVIILAAGGSSY